MGSVSAGKRCADQIWRDARLLGQTVSSDDAYSALKGLRTAAARLAMHQAHTAEVDRLAATAAAGQAHPLSGLAR